MVRKYFNDWKFADKFIGRLMEKVKIGIVVYKGQEYISIFDNQEVEVFGCIPAQYRDRVLKRCKALVHQIIFELEDRHISTGKAEDDVQELVNQVGAASVEDMFRHFIFWGRLEDGR